MLSSCLQNKQTNANILSVWSWDAQSCWITTQTALGVVKDKFNLNPLAIHIRNNISAYNQHICLNWIRGHSGTISNERADQLGKCVASDVGDYKHTKYPISFMKKELKTELLINWNQIWENSETGILTKELYFPTVESRMVHEFYEPSFILTQFMTGHGKFKSYFKRFNINLMDETSCSCGYADQTVSHLLFKCPYFLQKRIKLLDHLNNCRTAFMPPLQEKMLFKPFHRLCYGTLEIYLNFDVESAVNIFSLFFVLVISVNVI